MADTGKNWPTVFDKREPLPRNSGALSLAIGAAALFVTAGVCAGVGFPTGRAHVSRTIILVALLFLVACLIGWLLKREFDRFRQLGIFEEQARLARELHDGLLQSLFVARLKLELSEQLISEAPDRAIEELKRIQNLLGQEQQDLRSFVDGYKAAITPPAQSVTELEEMLGRIVHDVEQQCGLPVTLEVARTARLLPGAMAREIARIVREGLFNIVRHARASAARVEVAVIAGEVHLTISDNGRGFPFQGEYDHQMLTAFGVAPVVLKSRVDLLHGSLTIHSADTGADLDIRLPLPPKEFRNDDFTCHRR
ncbi:MAG TPA: sensor histidine kinase [Candidatus Binatia bacterium]